MKTLAIATICAALLRCGAVVYHDTRPHYVMQLGSVAVFPLDQTTGEVMECLPTESFGKQSRYSCAVNGSSK
ncbi:hypothetical protein BH09GEM1_BH09GEM1_24690 [soil metagenome]